MLHLFHGEHHIASRKELIQLKEKFKENEIVTLNGRNLRFAEIRQALESKSLFGTDRLVVIENLLTSLSKRRSKELDTFVKALLEASYEVVLWEEKELTKTVLKKFPKDIDIALFKPSRVLFRFLDTLIPGRSSVILDSFSRLCKQESIEMIFYMLCRQFRFLLLASSGEKSIPKLASWQQSRYFNQAKKFNQNKLLKNYQKLFQIDKRLKSGGSAFDLTREVERFLIEI